MQLTIIRKLSYPLISIMAFVSCSHLADGSAIEEKRENLSTNSLQENGQIASDLMRISTEMISSLPRHGAEVLVRNGEFAIVRANDEIRQVIRMDGNHGEPVVYTPLETLDEEPELGLSCLTDSDSSERRPTPSSSLGGPRFLKGKILVNMLFIESAEGAPDEHEDWETDEISSQVAVSSYSLATMAAIAPKEQDVSYEVIHSIVEVNGEPSAGNFSDIDAVADLLGISDSDPSLYDLFLQYEENLRVTHSANVVVTVMVAKDSVAPNFQGGTPALSWWPHVTNFGQTRYWVTIRNHGSWPLMKGIMDETLIHEMGHMFGNQNDEYSSSNGCLSGNFVDMSQNPPVIGLVTQMFLDAGAPMSQQSIPGSGGLFFPITNGNGVGCSFHSQQHDSIMKNGLFAKYPSPRPVMSWYHRVNSGWGSTASLRVRVEGIPQNCPIDFMIDDESYTSADVFRYVMSGNHKITAPKSIGSTQDCNFKQPYCLVGAESRTIPVLGSPFDTENVTPTVSLANGNIKRESFVHEEVLKYLPGSCGNDI